MKIEMEIPQEAKNKYLQRREKDLRDCLLALQSSDFDVFVRIGHQLKGNAITFGFEPLSEIGERLESSGKQQDRQKMQKALNDFETYIKGQIAP